MTFSTGSLASDDRDDHMSISRFEQTVCDLIRQDADDRIDRAWLVAVYLCLKTSEDLGYVRDDFVQFDLKRQEVGLLDVIFRGITLPPLQSDDTTIWLRGHFYNNALLRMVFLAETRLDMLWQQYNSPKRFKSVGERWAVQLDWYTSRFGDTLEFLQRAREQINIFKHDDTTQPGAKTPGNKGLRKIETMEDATRALQELLGLLSKLMPQRKAG